MTPVLSGFNRTLAVCASLVIAGIAVVYWRVLQAGFVGDDFMILHRLRPVADLGDALRFFRGEFFEYYRPLGFVSHAIDWLAAGANAREFHVTNLLLHLANTTLVLLIVHAVARDTVAAVSAALLFGLHTSNHEAVVWISARFDLLAAFFALAAIFWMVRRTPDPPPLPAIGLRAFAAVLFLAALLSKESVVALPVVGAAWAVFRLRATTAQTMARTLPWLAALALYAVLRSTAGGVPAAGGRISKLVMFAGALAAVVALADSRWMAVRDRLRGQRAPAAALIALGVVATALVAAFAGGAPGVLAREKLAVAGFAVFYLASPIVDLTLTPHFLDPRTNVYWLGGVAALALVAAAIVALWRPLLDNRHAWFAAACLLATLLPVSALTEGKRYLYLPSAAFAILVTVLIADLRVRARNIAVAALAVYVAVSAWQISRKTADWAWAGRMTAEGAQLVDTALAPQCGGQVVFLTSPVGVRGVYTHFYYETFELPRGCIPEVFQVLVRVVRLDTTVDVRREGPSRIVITAPEYQGNFVLSRDLRHFDVPLRAVRTATIDTPLGAVQAEAFGSEQRITLTLTRGVVLEDVRFFYYSNGAIRRVLP